MIEQVQARTRVYLDGHGLQDIDPSIIIRDVQYAPPQLQTSNVQHAKYNGARVTRQRIDQNGVSVSFEIHEYSTVARQNIAQRVVSWAMRGGLLTTDDRPGKRLRVICTQPPALQSTERWTEPLTVTFSAFDWPFWEDVQPHTLTLTGRTASGTLYAPGSAADPLIEATFRPSAGLTTLTITAGDTTFELTGLGVPSGHALEIGYDATHTLYIQDAESDRSYLAKRSADSADDLLIPIGQFSEVSYEANVELTATFRARGLYL